MSYERGVMSYERGEMSLSKLSHANKVQKNRVKFAVVKSLIMNTTLIQKKSILELVAAGKSSPEIAEILHLSVRVVRKWRQLGKKGLPLGLQKKNELAGDLEDFNSFLKSVGLF